MTRPTAQLLVLALLPLAALAQPPEIRLERDGAAPYRVIVEGREASTCTPQLDRTQLKQGQLTIVARQTDRDCAAGESQWRIHLDAKDIDPGAKLTGAAALPVHFIVEESFGEMTMGRLKGFALLDLTPDDAPQPESGLWRPSGDGSASGPGIGFALERQGNRWVMLSAVYDGEGNPNWHFSTAELDGAVLRAPLLSLFGGQTLFGSYQPPEAALEAGTVFLQFHSPVRADAWFVTAADDGLNPDLLLRRIPLERFRFGWSDGAARLGGRWLIVDQSTLETRAAELRPDAVAPEKLVDPSSGLELSCFPESSDDNATDLCSLRDASGAEIASFDEIGLRRMNGFGPGGHRVIAVRLD